MNATAQVPAGRTPDTSISFPTAFSSILLLWIVYTVIQTLFIVFESHETLVTLLEFLPGLLGIAVLLRAGFSREELFLRAAWPSWIGLLLLIALSLFWPFVLSTGSFIGWDWKTAIVQGAGGLSQELFFRAALLPALLLVFRNKPIPALGLQTVLFTIWHAGAFLVAPSGMLSGPIAIVSLSVIAGLIWGGQTLRDRTILWSAAHHTLLWVVGSMFYLGPPG